MDEYEIHNDTPPTIGERIFVGIALLVIVTLAADAVYGMDYMERLRLFYYTGNCIFGSIILANWKEFKNPHGIHDD